MLDLPVRQSMLLHSYRHNYLQLRPYFLSQISGQKSIKHTISVQRLQFISSSYVFLYIEDVNCCGDALIASLAQLSSNVES